MRSENISREIEQNPRMAPVHAGERAQNVFSYHRGILRAAPRQEPAIGDELAPV
jgi:hypothetical protein